MFDSKSPVVKVVGYLIIGFFALIIIISFGMPDFITDLSMDSSTIAIVNGQKVHRFDFIRYRDNRFGHLQNQKMDDFILNYYIGEMLIIQKAQDIGISPSDEKIASIIKNDITAFQNPETGKFDPVLYKRVRELNHFSKASFYETLKKDIIRSDFNNFVKMGTSVTPTEIITEYISDNSKIQIKYAILSENDIKKRYADNLKVSDEEINSELEKNKNEIKDPTSDKARIKKKLEKQKLNTLKKDLVEKVNKIAAEKGSFSQALNILNTQPKLSNIFKPGDPVKELAKNGKNIPSISNSSIFLEECLHLSTGQTSRVIESVSGLYIFTPVVKQIDTKINEDKKEELTNRLLSQNFQALSGDYLQRLQEKSKIRKNLKTD